jgi:hypothetical protein
LKNGLFFCVTVIFVIIIVIIRLYVLLNKPRGRRDVGRPRKRWTADVGTGDTPIP